MWKRQSRKWQIFVRYEYETEYATTTAATRCFHLHTHAQPATQQQVNRLKWTKERMNERTNEWKKIVYRKPKQIFYISLCLSISFAPAHFSLFLFPSLSLSIFIRLRVFFLLFAVCFVWWWFFHLKIWNDGWWCADTQLSLYHVKGNMKTSDS